MLRVTWPWHTRSCLIVTVWIYIYLTSATAQTCETKKDHRSSVSSTRVREGHAQGHVTLTYKVTLDSYSVDSYLFDIRDPKKPAKQKKKIIALASLVITRVRKGHAQGHVTLTFKVTLESYSVDFPPIEFHKQARIYITGHRAMPPRWPNFLHVLHYYIHRLFFWPHVMVRYFI